MIQLNAYGLPVKEARRVERKSISLLGHRYLSSTYGPIRGLPCLCRQEGIARVHHAILAGCAGLSGFVDTITLLMSAKLASGSLTVKP